MPKPDVTLSPAAIDQLPWERPEGAVDGVVERILTRDPETGSATRILRVDPYVDTGIFRHDHWEEVWMLSGSYKMGPEFHPTGTYTCKGPHVDHGPFITNDGYVGLEARDFLPESMDKPRATLLPIDIERLPATRLEGTDATARVLVAGPSGSLTRLVHVPAGVELSPRTLEAHEEWWVFEGDASAGDLELTAGTFIARSPGWSTGVLAATTDYLALEIRNHW